ncbi:MAG: phosphotransferase [Anaerolineae bacterium]|nr:phosphotransferase [Anaerolineae bacterium]
MKTIGLQNIETLARQESAKLHHYFIGVEHLFIALTQLKGGLTAAVLEHHGLSPRFVRYSIRETIGRYEDRRFWPGFPQTPRADHVLQMARAQAGDRTSSESDMLLAILDEGDSVVVRVLREMGANTNDLRRTAANWSAPLEPQAPEVPITGPVALSDDQRQVLQLMFRDYGEVVIIRELTGGYSGAQVLLVRPVRVDGRIDAPVVVKLDDRYAVLYERRRYDLHVKGTLPSTTAHLVDAPVVPDKCAVGGLKYTFVGKLEDTEPVSLREFAVKNDLQQLSDLIRSLYDVFGPAWWTQRKPYRFGTWREYEHVLPPALVVEATFDDQNQSASIHTLSPLGTWSRTDQIMAGERVVLNGFTVQKTDAARDVLYLAAGAQPEAINRSSKVEVRGLDVANSKYYRGEVIAHITGRVVRTRDDLLLRSVQSLEPEFDLRSDRIPSGHDTVADLPNPLLAVPQLLDRQISGFLSMIHGDLHLGNILVGPRSDPWLIDFGWTREGHTLFDWAMLEASLLVEVVARLMPPGWSGVWGTIGLLDSINRGEDRVFREKHEVARALTAVVTVRDIVRDCLGIPDRWDEYHVALALIMLRLMGWRSEGIDAQRLAFLVSALSVSETQTPSQIGGQRSWSETTTDMDRTEVKPDDL